MKGKIYFNEIKKEICQNQFFSKQHNYFSTKLLNLQNSQRDLGEADHLQSKASHFVFCHSYLLAPSSPSLDRLTQRRTVLTSTQ
jgi:hypothetical protein